MEARILSFKIALLTLLVEIRYTLSRLKADPLTAALVAPFAALRIEWNDVLATEIDLHEQLADAQAAIDVVDHKLDMFATRFSKALLTLVGDDRKHPLYVLFFSGKSISVFVRPKLGVEFAAIKEWVGKIQQTSHPALLGMLPEVIALVDEATLAIKVRDDVKTSIRTFRDAGARRQHFDKVNGARKLAAGALSKMALETIDLTNDFPHRFFRAEPAVAPDLEEEPTIESLTEEIQTLTQELATKNAQLAELNKAAAAQKKADEARAADEKALADLDKQIADAALAKKKLEEKLAK